MDWVYWIVAAGVLAVGEMITTGFFLGPIALAATLAALVALVGGGLVAEWIVFIAASAASLGLLRPIARRHLHLPAATRTGAAALVGARATVLEQVGADRGQVKIGGEIWSARAYDEDQVIEPGTRVEVLKIDGATALVSE